MTRDRLMRTERSWARAGKMPVSGGLEGGFALVFVLFTIMVVGILGSLILLYTAYALRTATGVTPAARAQTAAETGLDMAHARLASEDPDLVNLATGQTYVMPTTSLWDNKGSYSVTVLKNPGMAQGVTDGDPYDWLITSSGTYVANVEGVQRTFYRTLQEVITFAGGRYYNALNYVLFSKEGSIDLNLDGNLSALSIGQVTVNGDVYAGKNVTLANSSKLIGSNAMVINGDVITEKGDVIVRNRLLFLGGSRLIVNGNIYSGILAAPGSLGGGVNFDLQQRIANGAANIDVTGDVNSSGRLQGYDQGVRFDSDIISIGNSTTRVAGNIRSKKDVYAENRVVVAGTTNIQIEGTVNCGEDVTLQSRLVLAGATMNINVNGSIYAAGNVDVIGDGVLLGVMKNRIGGDIQAGGNVNVTHEFRVGCGSPSGYEIGGSIYGRNVTLQSEVNLAGTLDSSVGGNIYVNGGALNIINDGGNLATSRVGIRGSVYSTGNATLETRDGAFGYGPLTISGSIATLDPPGRPGAFSRTTLTANAGSSSSKITINGDARDSRATWPLPSNVTVTGQRTPAAPAFTPPVANPPAEPTPYTEVLLPQCDFDYYRELAKGQEATDGKDHYIENPGGGDYQLTIPEGMITSSLYVVFVEGNLVIKTVNVPINTTGVFVATGDIYLSESMRKNGTGVAEFQLICGGKMSYSSSFTFGLDAEDRIFIYAADKNYTPANPVSVRYQMGWNRGVYGQITARGDIILESTASQFKVGIMNHSITYRSPAVLGEAFRIPFRVKSWKEL